MDDIKGWVPIPPALMIVDHKSRDHAAPPRRHSCILFVEALEDSPNETEILVLNDLRKMLQKCSKRERMQQTTPSAAPTTVAPLTRTTPATPCVCV